VQFSSLLSFPRSPIGSGKRGDEKGNEVKGKRDGEKMEKKEGEGCKEKEKREKEDCRERG